MFSTEQILIFLGVLVTTGLLMKSRKRKETFPNSYPPSLPSWPLVGTIDLFFLTNITDIAAFFMKKAKQLGPIFTLRFGNRLVLTLNSREVIEKAYVKNASVFSDRIKIYMESLVNPENKGIIFVRKAADWKKPQKLVLSILKEFGFGSKSIMETRIQKEIEAMTKFAIDKKGKPLDPKEMCSLATSNIMMNILFGRRCDYEMGLSDLSIKIHQFSSDTSFVYDIVPLVRFLPSSLKKLKTYTSNCNSTFEYIEDEIAQSRQNTPEPCFVQSYIAKAGPDYDRNELNYILRDLLAAGTDTSSTTLQWGLMALANNPDIQQRLYDDIITVIPDGRLPTLQDEAKLPYAAATIVEITRWRTLAPLSSAREVSQSSVVDGYLIPAGSLVMANVYAVHNDINVWKDPDVFRPERFLDSDNNVFGKEKVIPFSVGRRSCPGETLARAELFLIITSLVKRFLILPPEGQGKINEDPNKANSIIVFPTPFKILLVERK